jgi:hypothetical protein
MESVLHILVMTGGSTAGRKQLTEAFTFLVK